MKRTIFLAIAAVAVLCASSCSKMKEKPEPLTLGQGEPVLCSFGVAGLDVLETKSTGLESDEKGIEAEKKINSLQVFVFTAEGNLAASEKAENASSLTLTVNAGTGYSMYAVVNTEDWTTSVSKVADLEAKVTEALGASNANANFAMRGKLTDQTVSSTSKEFTIEVERVAAKVVLRKITNALPTAAGALTIEGIYVSNVVTSSAMFAATIPEGATWINQRGVYDNLSSYAWFADKLETAVDVANGAAYSTAHTFYAAANPTETDSSAETFGPRFTRLVVKAKIQDVVYYYPVSFNKELPALTANSYIDVTNLTIKHLGSDDPDKPIETDAITVSVTVKDWTKTEKEVTL